MSDIKSTYVGRDVVELDFGSNKDLGTNVFAVFMRPEEEGERKGKVNLFVSWNKNIMDLLSRDPQLKEFLYHALDCARNSLDMHLTNAPTTAFTVEEGKGS